MTSFTSHFCRAALFCCVASNVFAAEPFMQHYEGVLGTTLDLTIYHDDVQAASSAANAVVAEVARMEQLLSSYRPDSELSRLNATHAIVNASEDLLAVARHCADWYEKTQHEFSCRLGSLQALWRDAEQSQVIPDRAAVRAQARAINQAEIAIDMASRSITMGELVSFDPNGLATGYIVDSAMELLRNELPDAKALKLDIGGDAAYWGTPPDQQGWQVGVADPQDPADSAVMLATLRLTSKAVTASGHVNRKRTIARREFSHILQARDGWPVETGTASVVVADTALVADVVATTLALQSISEGIDWVDSLEGVEALLIDSSGHQLASDGWNALLAGSGAVVDASVTANELHRFTLNYTLPAFDVAGYNRPYVAIWITDTAQEPRRNLLLLGDNERWARENTRWWRRVGRRNPGLLDGVARPTRAPGQYQLEWDGLDDFGKPMTQGDYELHLEVAREGGASSYQKIPFSWGRGGRQQMEIPASGELGTIELRIGLE